MDTLRQICSSFAIPVVDSIEVPTDNPLAFIDTVKSLEGEEGYIVRFNNGHMVKVKSAWYIGLHGMVDLLSREKDVLALVLGSNIDDAKTLMDEQARSQVDAYVEAVERGIADSAQRLKAFADASMAAADGDQKRFATEFVNVPSVPSRERGLIFQIARGIDPIKVVTDFVSKNVSTGPKVAEVRYLIGDAKWDDFRDQSVVVDD